MKVETISHEGQSEKIVVRFKNKPSKKAPELLYENLYLLEEGKTKEWDSRHTYRLDRRPANMGGDQLHVNGRNGQAWAYRSTGSKSEPHKYTSPATNVVKDIVSQVFKIDKANIEEAFIVRADETRILVELVFA